MMPGDSQSKTVAIAADATVGNCQNCSVLHQVRSPFYDRKVDGKVVFRLWRLSLSSGVTIHVFDISSTVGNCEFPVPFCFVSFRLSLQSLNEYVSSFLALKQKIPLSE